MHMKKSIGIVCCLMLLSSAVCAQEKTFKNVSEIILSHAEATISCAAEGKECSGAHILALKAAAANDVHDVVLLVTSGNLSRMKLANDQGMALTARLAALQSQLVQIELFDRVCNLGILFLDYGAIIMHMGVVYNFFPLMLLGLIMLPVAGLLMLSCFFWWL
jgi:hypothetical protein